MSNYAALSAEYAPMLALLRAPRIDQEAVASQLEIMICAARDSEEDQSRPPPASIPASADLVREYGPVIALLRADRDTQYESVAAMKLALRQAKDDEIMAVEGFPEPPALPGAQTSESMRDGIHRMKTKSADWQDPHARNQLGGLDLSPDAPPEPSAPPEDDFEAFGDTDAARTAPGPVELAAVDPNFGRAA